MKEREAFLDKLRAAATCAVVLLHTVTGVMDNTDMSLYPTERKVFLTVMDLVCWCVPVFLLISGYLFLQPERKLDMGRMVTKYCRRVVLALFLFGVPYACLELIMVQRSFRPGMIREGVLMVLRGESWSHMWYLYLILVLYFLTPMLKWLLARVPLAAVYGLELALFLGFSVLPYLARLSGWEEIAALPDWGIYFFYYICGYLFAVKGHGGVDRAEKAMGGRLLSGLAAMLMAGMAVSRLGGHTLQMAYNYPFTVLLSLLLFGWGVSGKGKPQAGTGGFFWEQAGALCFTVYLIHPVFLNVAYKFFRVTPLSFPIGISLPLFFLSALLLSAAGAWVLRKIPLLRKYVL